MKQSYADQGVNLSAKPSDGSRFRRNLYHLRIIPRIIPLRTPVEESSGISSVHDRYIRYMIAYGEELFDKLLVISTADGYIQSLDWCFLEKSLELPCCLMRKLWKTWYPLVV